jgi:hypothetical protein
MGRTVLASYNQCGPGDAMIAVLSTDVCGPLQVGRHLMGRSFPGVAELARCRPYADVLAFPAFPRLNHTPDATAVTSMAP